MKEDSFRDMSDEELLKTTAEIEPGPGKALRIYELARRSLTNRLLVDAACAAISSEKIYRPRQGPPHAWLGGALIMRSDNAIAIQVFLGEMNLWTPRCVK